MGYKSTDVMFYLHYIKHYAKKALRKARNKLGIGSHTEYKKYAGRDVICQNNFNKEIYDLLKSGKPFMVSRFGSNEILNIVEYLAVRCGVKKHMNAKYVRQLHTNAGVFPAGEQTAKTFAEYVLEYVKDIDYLGAWFRNMEDYILRKYMTGTKPVRLKYLEPYCADFRGLPVWRAKRFW